MKIPGAGVGPGDRVLDMYCGAGTIGLSLAPCRQLVGVDYSAPSILGSDPAPTSFIVEHTTSRTYDTAANESRCGL